MRTWTKEEIKTLLIRRNDAVERGIVRIYQNQTADEQSEKRTKYLNNRGFNATDARYGTYLARYVLEGRPLTGKFLYDARKMCIKYSRQLCELANQKG